MNLDVRLIENIREIGKKHAIKKIVLFGSRSRGDNRLVSDIDLAIFPMSGFAKRGTLASELEDLHTLLKVDIVFIDESIDSLLIKNIEREGVALYERTVH